MAWNGSTSPSPSEAAHTDTAVPSSTSRASEITPPAPQPTSVIGPSISWTAASVASGAARWAPEANRTARSQARPLSPRGRGRGRLERPRPGVGRGREAGGDVDAHPSDDTPGRARDRDLRADRRGQDRGRDRARRAAARRRGRTRWRSPPTRMQVYDGLPILSGRRDARASARGSSTGCSASCRSSEPFSAGAYARARARRDRRRARRRAAADRRRRHRPLPARRAGRARPAPAGAGRARARWQAAAAGAGPGGAARRADPRARPTSPPASRPPTASGLVRTLELLDAGRAAAAAGGDSQLWTTDTRHPTLLAGLVMDRDALRRADRRARRRDGRRRRRARRWRAADATGARPPRARRSASRSCSPATSRR